MDLFTDLAHRGLIQDVTDETALRTLFATTRVTAYCGFDPTADSLHVGSLVPLLNLARLQRAGHRPIAVAGGATGLIGDPSGKSKERLLLDAERLAANVAGIKAQIARFLDFGSEDTAARDNAALLVDNADWLGPMSLVAFLRDIGKHFTVNYMVAKDSVKSRMNEREGGISFTEFSYMLLQSADFLHLFREHGCALQIGGSDQFGNITAGIELVRRVTGGQAYGLTFPLVTTAAGTKFGKTEQGTIWLDAARTSPFQLYQYFVRTDDRDVGKFLRWFTFLDLDEIGRLEALRAERPGDTTAHKALAREVTTLVHGAEATQSAIAASDLLYGGSVQGLTERDLLAAAEEIPKTEVAEPFGEARDVIDLLSSTALVQSRGEAKRAVQQGGAYVNNERIPTEGGAVSGGRLLFGRYLLLRKGKRDYHLLVFPS